MQKHLVTALIGGIFVLLPNAAIGQSAFDKYRQQKDKEIQDYTTRRSNLFNDYAERKRREFNEYRSRKNQEFASYMERKWQSVSLNEPLKRPEEKELEPVVRDERDDDQQKAQEIKATVIQVKPEVPQPQPEPVKPILENQTPEPYSTFTFYGTPMKVRWGKLKNFKLAGSNEKSMAKGFRTLADTINNNVFHDCLKLREAYNLCDWAYYQMLEKLAEEICGKGTNEAVLLHGVLFQQSGYEVRFCLTPTDRKLHLLTRLIENPYDCRASSVNGKLYYLLDGCQASHVDICSFGMAGERHMTLSIDRIPRLAKNNSQPRQISAASYPLSITSVVNKNLIDFYLHYPASCKDGNMMTRWAYYANAPASPEMRESLYPKLREKLANLPKPQAVNWLLSLLQPDPEDVYGKRDTGIGLPYMYDSQMWNCIDRANFAEETLYYPGSDCEDHAILLSRLIRDLLDLDVVLVYYPGHLATAVCFNSEQVNGDYINVNGRKFVVADPTYSRGKLGKTMPECRGKEVKTILCER